MPRVVNSRVSPGGPETLTVLKYDWETIDGIEVPVIYRKDSKFLSVRIVEVELLGR